MNEVITIKDIEPSKENINIIDGVENINTEYVKELEAAKAAFDNLRFDEAEQIFAKIKGSEAASWRILSKIATGDIGKKGGKITTLLQESVKNSNANIGDTITSLKILIEKYKNTIDRKIKSKAIMLLNDISNHTLKGKLAVSLSDINKRALQVVKEKGYNPSIYDDKIIPMKVLNNRLKKPKYRIRHYNLEEIELALKIIYEENFLQEVVDEYMLMAHSNIVKIEKDYLDTRDQDIIKYIKSLYISNIAYEKKMEFTRSIDKIQFIDILSKLSERGRMCITFSSVNNTRYFNAAEEKVCEEEIKKASTGFVVVSLKEKDIIEKRAFLIDESVTQISKEDLVIGDVTNKYTHEYIGPIQGTIYYDL